MSVCILKHNLATPTDLLANDHSTAIHPTLGHALADYPNSKGAQVLDAEVGYQYFVGSS